MTEAQANASPNPSATGVLARTPLAHLYVYLSERRLTGTLVLLAARAESEETEGVLIAFEGYSSFGRTQLFNVHDVHVAPAARGKGLGTAMLEVLADLGREHGFGKITLEVAASNGGAIRLYRRLGYTGLDGVAATAPAGVTYFATRKL